jgi:hypothetical protein
MIGIRTTKTRKAIDRQSLRGLCIAHQYYTRGDCEAYEELLNFVDDRNITDTDIIAIADDIYDHSDIDRIMREYGCSSDEVFDSIYFNVGELVHWFCESRMI